MCFMRAAEFTAFHRPQPPPARPRRSLPRRLFTSPLRGPAGGCTRTAPTPSAGRAGPPSPSAGGAQGAPTCTPPSPPKRLSPEPLSAGGDLCAKLRGRRSGRAAGGRRAAGSGASAPTAGVGRGRGVRSQHGNAARSTFTVTFTHAHAAAARLPPAAGAGRPAGRLTFI